MADYELPACFEVYANGKTMLVSAERCLADPDIRRQVVNRAYSALESWYGQYSCFLRRVGHEPTVRFVEAVEQLRQQIGADWPSHYDGQFYGSHGD